MFILPFLVSTLVAVHSSRCPPTVHSSCCPLLLLSSSPIVLPLAVLSSLCPLAPLRQKTLHLLPCHNNISYSQYYLNPIIPGPPSFLTLSLFVHSSLLSALFEILFPMYYTSTPFPFFLLH